MTIDEFTELGLVKGDNISVTMNDKSEHSGEYDCLSAPVAAADGYNSTSYKREKHPAKVVINQTIKYMKTTKGLVLDEIKSIERINEK